ncbi:uncharacterized protein TM35_000021230 [Trypanosoma theileri]|uniref:Uncharacterized protein n=1 Tax=Trypanosoma theileri TaxID=67003 RepID=A0A1X0P777_9TRYP|nr:uncharacterized protein TM35_000021230 [Trypanosoma theileri]ORC92797.1 hypothetical protein TM35_000021230 [Trypanosoma theileri]
MQEAEHTETRTRKVVRLTRSKGSADNDNNNSNNNNNNNSNSGTGTTSGQPVVSATQVVHTFEEGNALVKRLRQLESENATLASSLTKVCDENAKLADYLAQQEAKYTALAQSPLSTTSVLHSLFEPEKTGWFGGSKSAAREKLEQFVEELQNEFLEYKANHASSNEEVQVLIGEVQNAHMNAQRLSAIIHEQQEAISRGPLSVAVRIVSAETEAENISLADLRREMERRSEREDELRQELRRTCEELQAKTAQNIRLQQELQSAESGKGLSSEVEVQQLKDEVMRLEGQVKLLKDSVSTGEQLHELKVKENDALQQKLKEVEEQLRIASVVTVAHEDSQRKDEVYTSAPCERCKELQKECDAADERLQNAHQEFQQQLEERLTELTNTNQQVMEELQRTNTELEEQIQEMVPIENFKAIDVQRESLVRELELATTRVRELEVQLMDARSIHTETSSQRSYAENSNNSNTNNNTTRSASVGNNNNNNNALDEAKILATLERNKERISRIEFQRDQLIEEGKRLREVAVAKEEELLRVTRSSQEDKQRINFLLKRCVTITNDLNSVTSAKEALSEQYESAQLELGKLRRQCEEMQQLQQRINELKEKNDAMQDRLSSVEELENELVKAKETIAYMELAQSQTINMSQYAELQSKNSKLENTIQPVKKQLEDTRKEVEKMKAENESLHAVLTRQQNTMKSHEEQVTALQANDAKMREKTTNLTAENARLRDVNNTLEAQMNNMQDGIKEMAVKLEQERAKAKTAAETTYKGEIVQLQQQLAAATATIASLRAGQDANIPESIHKNVLAAKERVEEENKRMSFDLDKLKSEIIIYRQTIDDLESENEEYVREIESLQEAHMKERSTASERLAAETKKLTEANRLLEELRVQLGEHAQQKQQLTVQKNEMEDIAQKNRRAFEDKCRQEEKLLATLEAVNREMEAQREELQNAKMSLQEHKKEVEISAGAAETTARECADECEKLRQELQRITDEKLEMKHELEKLKEMTAKNAKNTIPITPTPPPPTTTNSRAARSVSPVTAAMTSAVAVAEIAPNTVMSGMVESGLSSSLSSSPSSSDPTVLRARAEQLQMSLIQTQRQMEEQRQKSVEAAETFGKALDKADAEIAELRKRVREQEEELRNVADGKDPLGTTQSPRPKKKKNVKKGLSAMAHLDELKETDVLEVSDVAAAASSYRAQEQLAEEHQQRKMALENAEKELSMLRDENLQLKEKIATLTDELNTAREDLERATGGDVDKQKIGLKENISLLELQQFQTPRTTQMEEQIRQLSEENKGLKTKLETLKTLTQGPSNSPDVNVQQLKAELSALTKELVPTKNKLVEYMAMSDRLGIQYPFSAEMEGTAVLRLKAMHFDSRTGRVRASSAPRHLYASNNNDDNVSRSRGKKTDLLPRIKSKVKKHQKKKQENEVGDNVEDLR